ncbi:hypothetical protein K491DRAFT_692041 [Lophiostoma macrostomum CBS 122681]|uniref:JmjC domain-containing protein n=1 Tax=Lophiostoma macrostomum CBS 122681 TaxID=1314788 RepID=A0A6A6T9Z8_9PLEO|nr:hypothetical protein K491DRAFT_692041 [Lophiostoma macrostomum CBS 122681]
MVPVNANKSSTVPAVRHDSIQESHVAALPSRKRRRVEQLPSPESLSRSEDMGGSDTCSIINKISRAANVPEEWRDALDPVLNNTIDARESRIRPFRNAILSGRLAPLTNCAYGIAEDALDNVDIRQPIIWSGKDHVGVNTADIRTAIEDAFCGFGESAKKIKANGQHYEADYTTRQLHACQKPEINLRTVQGYHDTSRTPQYLVLNVLDHGFPFFVPKMIEEREHPFYNDEGQVDHLWGANYTPGGVAIDLHIDNGARGSTWHGEGPKLWTLYPPTPNNVSLLCEKHAENNRYELIEEELEGGCYAVFFSTQSIEIPPGWLHATYALGSGFVNGTNWWCAEGLEVSAEIYSNEIRLGQSQDLWYVHMLLRTLSAAVTAPKGAFYVEVVNGLRKLCPQKMGRPLSDFVKGKIGNKKVKELSERIQKKIKADMPDAKCDTCSSLLGHLP